MVCVLDGAGWVPDANRSCRCRKSLRGGRLVARGSTTPSASIVGHVEIDNRGCARLSPPEQNHLRQRDALRVGDGEQGGPPAHPLESTPGAALEDEPWRAAGPNDLDVSPEHVLREPRAERLHRGFLRGESSREMDPRPVPPPAVRDFALGENPLNEALSPTHDHVLHAFDVRRIETEADDVGHRGDDSGMTLPTPDDSFEWRHHEGRPCLVCRPLEPFATHVFTTSAWALGSRTRESVRESGESSLVQAWRQLSDALSVGHRRLVRATQVHGAAVIVGTRSAVGRAHPEADIILLRESDAAAAVQAADCVPMLMVDRETGAVAAAHAGWRGMVARVPQVTLRALETTFGSRPADVIVALGPSIGACCYEVGLDVRDAFAGAGFTTTCLDRVFLEQPTSSDINQPLPTLVAAARRSDHWFFDGWQMTSDQLVEAGVPRAQIYSARLCTASHPQVLCSYRRDGAPAGRIVGAIRCQPRPSRRSRADRRERSTIGPRARK